MTGLLVKELMMRSDLERCLNVSSGSLTEQWKDELANKFGLEFETAVMKTTAAKKSAQAKLFGEDS